MYDLEMYYQDERKDDEEGLKDVEEIKKDIQYLATLMGKEEQKDV